MSSFLKTLVVILVLGAVIASGELLLVRRAEAAPVTATMPTGATTMETIACNSGVSPCSVQNTSTTILNPGSGRAQCLLQNVGTTDYYCVQGATVAGAGTASTSNMHFILKAASNANKGDGGSYTCNQGPAMFRGAIVCIGSAASGGSLNASAATAAGF